MMRKTELYLQKHKLQYLTPSTKNVGCSFTAIIVYVHIAFYLLGGYEKL